jgi:hypothetical protein
MRDFVAPCKKAVRVSTRLGSLVRKRVDCATNFSCGSARARTALRDSQHFFAECNGQALGAIDTLITSIGGYSRAAAGDAN